MEDFRQFGASRHTAFGAHDADVLAALSHPDMITVRPRVGRHKEVGLVAERECNHSWFEGFPDGRITASSEVTTGEYTVQEGTFEGTNTGTFKTESGNIPATGRSLKGRYSQVSRVVNGVLVSTNLYFDKVER
jgi:predicted ester cyclase